MENHRGQEDSAPMEMGGCCLGSGGTHVRPVVCVNGWGCTLRLGDRGCQSQVYFSNGVSVKERNNGCRYALVRVCEEEKKSMKYHCG